MSERGPHHPGPQATSATCAEPHPMPPSHAQVEVCGGWQYNQMLNSEMLRSNMQIRVQAKVCSVHLMQLSIQNCCCCSAVLQQHSYMGENITLKMLFGQSVTQTVKLLKYLILHFCLMIKAIFQHKIWLSTSKSKFTFMCVISVQLSPWAINRSSIPHIYIIKYIITNIDIKCLNSCIKAGILKSTLQNSEKKKNYLKNAFLN